VYITNSGWKAVAIGANTAQNFPSSMQIQDLQISSPVDTYNVLLMNFSGFQVPLQTTSINIGSNSALVMQSSSLETGNLLVGGTFDHGDSSQVKVHGALQLRKLRQFANDELTPAVYFLTNGTLSVDTSESLGGFVGPGQFVQYGGLHTVGGLGVSVDGEFDIYDGQFIATNGITVGFGDYADYANFYQYGGSVNADTVINGNYFLNGGTITGHMQVPSITDYQRVNGSMLQNGGTNHAISLHLGDPNRFGGGAIYVLSNGVVQVDSSVPFLGGWFSQYNGVTTIASNFIMQGEDVGPGFVYAEYLLAGGTLLVGGGLTAQAAHFQQDGGTNSVAGDLVLGIPPLWNYPYPGVGLYALSGGSLFARNIIVNVNYYGEFHQTGGTNQIAEKLTVQGQGQYGGFLEYTLEGGSLAVKDINVGDGAFFQHTSGKIIHSGVLTLYQGDWHAATGDQGLGPLQLALGQSNISTIGFPDGSSILRLADSSAEPWSAGAMLYINNWHGSASGGGATRLYFGSGANGLTSQQLVQIRFVFSGHLYPATILATGEVVPVAPPLVEFTRNGDTVSVTWGPGWTLQSSTNATGPWQDVNGATSPYNAPFTEPQRFFRLKQ
jgi:hypothetical protein